MCEGKSRRDFYTSDETVLPSISDQETETLNYKNEKKGWQRTSLSDSFRGTEELRGSTINQHNKICWSKATHNPIDSQKWHPNLDQNEYDIRPIHFVKGLYQI